MSDDSETEEELAQVKEEKAPAKGNLLKPIAPTNSLANTPAGSRSNSPLLTPAAWGKDVATKHHITISGMTLGLGLEHLFCAEHDLEGLLFGSVSCRSRHVTDDKESRKTIVDVDVAVRKFLVVGGPFSLYDFTGTIHTGKVRQAIQSADGEFLGWFRVRANTERLPSLRETHVHEQLNKLRDGMPHLRRRLSVDFSSEQKSNTSNNVHDLPASGLPFLFALFTSQSADAIQAYDHKFFEAAPDTQPCRLLPVNLAITNLSQGSSQEYSSFFASTPLGSAASSSSSGSASSSIIEAAANSSGRAQELFGGDKPQYIHSMEEFVEACVAQMKNATQDVSDLAAEMSQLLEQQAKLRTQLQADTS